MKLPFELYLDLQIAQSQAFRERGSIRYALEHARALVKKELVRAVGLNPLAPFPQNLDLELRAFPGLQWSTAENVRRAVRKGPLAFHMMSPFAPSYSEYLLAPWALSPRIPLIVTLVDLTPLLSEDPALREPRIARRYRSRFRIVEQADLVLAISQNTATEAVRILDIDPARVVNIGTGVSGFFSPPAPGENPAAMVRSRLDGITRPYVLSLTGTWAWKNTQRLIESYARLAPELRSDLQLVIVCRLTEEYRRKWTEHAEDCGLGDDEMVLTDLVSDQDLRSLYRTAELFVYPSLYEGFGLPAAEAAACGCPILVSNTSSMPEIADFPAGTFDPTNVDEMSALMHRALTDDSFKMELTHASARAASRHTWDAVAERTSRALATLPPRPYSAVAPGDVRRVAVAGTFHAIDAEPAFMNAIKQMAKLCKMDLLVADEGEPEALRRDTGARVFSLAALGRHLNPGSYDAIIYRFDSCTPHPQIQEQALRFPGIVWLAEASLAKLYPSFGHVRPPASPLIDAARGVVGTSAGRRRIELDQGPLARLTPFKDISASNEESAAHQILDFVAELASETS